MSKMKMAKYLLEAYGIVAFFYAIHLWFEHRDYARACQEIIALRGNQEEKIMAMAGFHGRDEKGLFDIAYAALKWPDKVMMHIFVPDATAEVNSASAQIESITKVGEIERKYCSDIKGRRY